MIARIASRRTTIATAALAVAGFNARGQEASEEVNRAPFGLVWGMSTEDARKAGVTLTTAATNAWGQTFTATGLSRALSDLENVLLSFGFQNRLFRVVAGGRSNGSDPYGSRTVARYEELSKLLSERYGRGRETSERDTAIWRKAEEYVMSLRQGRARRFTSFTGAATNVELSVRATDSDTSHYVIIFEHIEGLREFEADKRRRERDSL